MAGKPLGGDQQGRGFVCAMNTKSEMVSSVEAEILEGYLQDFRFALASDLDIQNALPRHYHIRLDGRHVLTESGVLVSGVLLHSWSQVDPLFADRVGDKVVVRVSQQNWLMVVKHTDSIRVLNAPLLAESSERIIDTTTGSAVVSGGVLMRSDDCIQVAEIFCGGFLGWGQAASVLAHHAIPVRVKWMLDREPVCIRSAEAQFDNLLVVQRREDHERAVLHNGPVFLNQDAAGDGWLQVAAAMGARIWCVSPPCQPWSQAGNGQGLHSAEGQLMYRIISLLEVFRPDLCCIEQVAGFVKHRHFAHVKAAWQMAGYRQVWSKTMDLVDYAPESRKRFFLVLVREDLQDNCQSLNGIPVMPKRPTLGAFNGFPSLPEEMRRACMLSPQTLSMYLDPYYMPPSRIPGKVICPIAFRVKGPNDRLNTVMAQYHFQHELPHDSLVRGGILGCLLRDHQGLRFAAGAEVALIHCSFEPVFLPRDDREQMKVMGNSLAVPQAIFPLAYAVSCLQEPGSKVDPCQAIQWSVGDRLRADSVAIIQLRDGWVMCSQAQVPQAMKRLRPGCPWGQIPLPETPPFQTVWLQDSSDKVAFAFGSGIGLSAALQAVGLDFMEADIEDICPLHVAQELPLGRQIEFRGEACVEVPAVPWLCQTGLIRERAESRLLAVVGQQATYVLRQDSPALAHFLNQVLCLEGFQDREVVKPVWLNMQGLPLTNFTDFKDTFFLLPDSEADPLVMPDAGLPLLQGIQVQAYADPPRLFLRDDVALHLCAGLPLQFFAAIGWFPRLSPSRSQHCTGLAVTFQPIPDRVRFEQEGVIPVYRDSVFQGCLQDWQNRAGWGTAPVKVKIQVFGRVLWKGLLPGDLTFQGVLDAWQAIGAALGLPSRGRIGSGPLKPVGDLTLLQAILEPHAQAFVNRQGYLLVTLLPEVRGGGAKDEKFLDAQTRLAKEFLEHGLSLTVSSSLVDKLIQQAGLARVVKALSLSHPENRWRNILQLCQQFGLEVPQVQARFAKAEHKARAQAKSRPSAGPAVTASDVRLQEGFFKNADGSPAAILSALFPGCTGVCLQDPAEALQSIEAFHSFDELAVVVLGHRCPHAASCCGRLTVPALHSVSEPILVTACLHQLGDKKVQARCEHAADVTAEASICAAFTVFKDDWTAPEWQSIVMNPVRRTLEIFRENGLQSPFSTPWGRSFRTGSGPSTPGQCSNIQFHARVAKDGLAALLQRSGFNRVYVTPKAWNHELLPGWSIIWLGLPREEATILAMKAQEQCGLVRSRDRIGVRVADKDFASAHKTHHGSKSNNHIDFLARPQVSRQRISSVGVTR